MFREAGLGPCEFRPRVVGGDAAGRVDEGSAGGLAAEFVVVEDGAQFEEGRALAAGEFERGGDVGLACVGSVWVWARSRSSSAS
jgi:hypothetical protein